jgi:hypothetical protein
VWKSDILNSVDDYYIVSDPDLYISNVPYDLIDVLIYNFDKYENVSKVGLHVSWESDKMDLDWYKQVVFGNGELNEDEIYESNIDTTFALYSKKRGFPNGFFTGVRVGGLYTCKHMPFYLSLNNTDKDWPIDVVYYVKNANKEVSNFARCSVLNE